MKLKPKDILIPTLVLFLIALLTTAALAGTNLLTADKIVEQNHLAENNARQEVLADADSFEPLELPGTPEQGVTSTYYVGKKDGEVAGYVFSSSSAGYGGNVNIMTGIDADGKVTGVAIVSHNETPGLGANAEKPAFRQQFDKLAPDNGFELVKSGTPNDKQILAMTGATITSRAVNNSVNKAINAYHLVKEGN